ncbi:transmembrane protein 120 [Tanacetum coccineum]
MGDSTTTTTTGDSDRDVCSEVNRIIEESKELQESASNLISKNSIEEASLRQRALALDSNIKIIKSFIGSEVKKGALDSKHADKLGEDLSRASYTLSEGDAATFLPCKSHGRFLRMFLGPINVRANRKDVQLKVKEEYYSFRRALGTNIDLIHLPSGIVCILKSERPHIPTSVDLLSLLTSLINLMYHRFVEQSDNLHDRTAYLFLIFPSLLLGLRSWLWDGCFPALPVQLYQAWLLFLYTGLALRENILRVNGSDIRPWWIYHHYCAMAMALISLTWEIERQPDCAQKQKGIQLFLRWAIMQGVAMLLQNRYQRQRLYTRIALGKARRMDVVWGETAAVKGQLWLLLPILFVLQAFEAYVGVLLLQTAVAGVISEWQVITCGILLIIMAVGNFANTVQTLVLKSQFKAKMKKGKSKSDLTQVSPTLKDQ